MASESSERGGQAITTLSNIGESFNQVTGMTTMEALFDEHLLRERFEPRDRTS
jgi:hypothetical protein